MPSMVLTREVKIRTFSVIGFVALMWFVRALDALLPGARSAAGFGIIPRTWNGLDGIPVAPFIHVDLGHLLANSVPLIVLGTLIVLRGAIEFGFVVLVSTLVSGIGTWLFGSGNSQHIGASGVVFGFFGYLLFRGAFDRRIASILITLAVAVLYGTGMAWSLVPAQGISWSLHFFGFVGGFAAARLRYPSRRRLNGLKLVKPDS